MLARCPNCQEPIPTYRLFITTAWGSWRCGRCDSLLGVNVMILTTVGFWSAYFADTEPYVGLAMGGKILIFIMAYIFFMLFFAAPRMLFLLKRPGTAGVATFILQTGFYVWQLLSGTAWD